MDGKWVRYINIFSSIYQSCMHSRMKASPKKIVTSLFILRSNHRRAFDIIIYVFGIINAPIMQRTGFSCLFEVLIDVQTS